MKEINIKNQNYISELNNIIVEIRQSVHYQLSESVYYKIFLCVRTRNWDRFWSKMRDQVNETK